MGAQVVKIKTKNSIELYKNHKIDVKEIMSNSKIENIEQQSLFICDLSEIVQQYLNWIKHMPRVKPFYAVKCNDDINVLRILYKLGSGFDCASKMEISKILKLGTKPERIIFANPTKAQSHIAYAYHKGVNTMTFDNDFELHKIKKHHPNARLVIRIRCDAKKSMLSLGRKFGCDPEKDAPQLLVLARSLGLQIVGVAFHVGSGCYDLPVYERAILASRKLFDYALTIGYKFTTLDIGGGFFGYRGSSLSEVAQIINGAIDTYFPEKDIMIISEPGRYFVASAFTLVCKIHSKRETLRDDGKTEIMYYINDGNYGSFRPHLYDICNSTPQILMKNPSDLKFKSSVWGQTCDSHDQIAEKIMLPKLDINDTLVFENMGAYSLPIATNFNGYPMPKVKYFLNIKHK